MKGSIIIDEEDEKKDDDHDHEHREREYLYLRKALMKGSRSPSMTEMMSEVSWPVRTSLTSL